MNTEILMAQEYDAATGEMTTRELTSEEIAELENIAAESATRENQREAKAAARASALAKLADLGLTAEEIAAL
jgi:hypothetical protein